MSETTALRIARETAERNHHGTKDALGEAIKRAERLRWVLERLLIAQSEFQNSVMRLHPDDPYTPEDEELMRARYEAAAALGSYEQPWVMPPAAERKP